MSSGPFDLSFSTRLTGVSYSATRRALAEAARVDVVGCVNLAQRMVAQQLRAQAASESLVRMAGSDLVETLLARACLQLASTLPVTAPERRTALTAYLCAVLVRWLLSRTEQAADQRALERADAALHR